MNIKFGHTVWAADVGGINNVKPPSIQIRLRNIVAGLGARYLCQNKFLRPDLYKQNGE